MNLAERLRAVHHSLPARNESRWNRESEGQSTKRTASPRPSRLAGGEGEDSSSTRRLRFLLGRAGLVLSLIFAAGAASCAKKSASGLTEFAPGISYTNYRVASVPWSIHVAQVDRSHPELEFHSTHARGAALGLGKLSDQVKALKPEWGTPLAGVNGDFYQRDKAYAGDPRGLQIVEGELISGPTGGVSFWTDAAGQPHATNVVSLFQVAWPDGVTTSFGLNEERRPDAAVLYTPALGASTHTTGGRELILERGAGVAWLPLRAGQDYAARVREVREAGDTPLMPEIMVLSLGPALVARVPSTEAGAVLRISTTTVPDLKSAATAISGGPVLVREGRRQTLNKPAAANGELPYEFRSMWERHPRTAVGWSHKFFFLVEVDGRQKNLSVGMTLDELADYLVKLGCEEAMNLDGGGSATLWCQGRVANSPSDGNEREIANALIVVRKGKGRIKAASP